MDSEEIAGRILLVILLVLFAAGIIHFQNIKRSKETLVGESFGNSMMLTESLSPFGSWFKPDELTIDSYGFYIKKNSFLGNQSISFPKNKIKKIIFEDGLTTNSVEIVPYDLFERNRKFFYKAPDTRMKIELFVFENSKGQIIVEDHKTFLKQLLD